jgi:hypothetical protein
VNAERQVREDLWRQAHVLARRHGFPLSSALCVARGDLTVEQALAGKGRHAGKSSGADRRNARTWRMIAIVAIALAVLLLVSLVV